MVTPSRRVLIENSPQYFPFGNTRFRNVLQDFYGQPEDDDRGIVKILFLGSGDLRNMLATCFNNAHFKAFHIHLNDHSPSIAARNVVILKILSKMDFNVDKEEDIAFLWDVWYNAEWPHITRKRFQIVLKDLLSNLLPNNVIIPTSAHLESLRGVWSEWNSISSKNLSESKLQMKKLNKDRSSSIIRGWHGLDELDEVQNQELSTIFSKTVDEIAFQWELNAGVKDLWPDSLRKKLRDEARMYFRNGTCRINNAVVNVCVNPTMLDPKTQNWHVYDRICPFDGYLPFFQDDSNYSISHDGTIIRSCQKMLKSLVIAYRKRIETVKIFFNIEDALEFCYAKTAEKFDVIDCSNLADHIGLANILNASSERLKDNPGALLFTETMNWRYFAASVTHYVEKALCAPLTMIPTMYGLRLAGKVELGSSSSVNLRRLTMHPVNLCWTKVSPFKNIVQYSSPLLNRCVVQLAQKCCITKGPRQCKVGELGEQCGMLLYTPVTFSYVVSSMIKRIGEDCWLNINQMNLPSTFSLTRRTVDAWKDRQTVLKFSFDIQWNCFIETALKNINSQTGIPVLRLVLAPLDTIVNCFMSELGRSRECMFKNFQASLSGSNIHFIDNFQMEFKNIPLDRNDTISFSFLLAADHKLDETHVAFIMDLVTGLPIFFFQLIKSMRVENYPLLHPFCLGEPSVFPPVPSCEKFQMRVGKFIESGEQYIVKIQVDCDEDISGLNVSTNQQWPFRSTHDITVSLNRPNKMKPLTLSIPYPVVVEDIQGTIHQEGRFINLVLKKALAEPWPCEYQPVYFKKWTPDRLKPWEDGKRLDTISTHVDYQFNLLHRSYLQLKTTALNEIRGIVRAIFINASNYGRYLFGIQQKDSHKSSTPDWFIRVHLPIRTSPLGDPILFVSAADQQLAETLISQGKLDKSNLEENLFGIFANTEIMTFWTYSLEEVQLWRYILRLNSTKVAPSTWQINNLSLGENSPWLATCIVPLYLDALINQDRGIFNMPLDTSNADPVNKKDFYYFSLPSSDSISRINAQEKSCCATCKAIGLKLRFCSRCRAISYCSVECQRAHWAQHKVCCLERK